MTRTRFRSLAALAAGALLLAPLAGCGGDDEKADAKASSATAKDAGASGKVIDQDEFVSKILDAMKGKTSAHMTISGGSSINADADLTFGVAKPAIEFSIELGTTKIRLIAAGDALYLRQGANEKYVKIGKDDPTYGSLLGTFSDFGPQSAVEGIKTGISKVVEVGPATVDGQDLTQYDVTADTSKATGAIKSLAGASGAASKVTLQFYLDSDGLLNQIGLELNGEKATVAFTDWDKPVTIKVPTGNELLTPGS